MASGVNTLERNKCSEFLTDEQIFQNFIDQQETSVENNENNRQRQFGRRTEPLPPFTYLNSTNENIVFNENGDFLRLSAQTPSSIPTEESCSHNANVFVISDENTAPNLQNTSPPFELSDDSGEPSTASDSTGEISITVSMENNQENAPPMVSENIDSSSNSDFNFLWPHKYSRTLSLISCTLGLFNISRFAVLTINYGGVFLIQFLLFSTIFGIPFLWLQMTLGEKIKTGPISMWKISPICIGIGISIILMQYCITIYSSVSIAWLLVYIRDIIINKSHYPWLEVIHQFNSTIPRISTYNDTNLTNSIPDYFHINVLQRLKIFNIIDGTEIHLHISDRVAFYLVLLWFATFLILCKGLKSLGNIMILFGVLPIFSLTIITVKMLFIVDFSKLQNIFSFSKLDEFLINSKSWTAAAQEAFLTWGLLGASVIGMSSRTCKNSSKILLRRDAIIVVLATLIGLCLSALVGLCCIQIVNDFGYVYVPGSYESPEHYSSIFNLKSNPRSNIFSYPTNFLTHYSSLIGEVYNRNTDCNNVSGYQALPFITEILPAAVAVSTQNISWIWTLFIYITFLIFGLFQLCVMWKPISCALGNSSSAVLLSCITGLLLSIPFATELGITLIHYMDILFGGAWLIPVLWAAEIFGVFLIRGGPYNADDLVKNLKMCRSLSTFLVLSWNVLLPIGLITLAVVEYKTLQSKQLYEWRHKSYFTYLSGKVAAITQILVLLLIPISSLIQIYRYLTAGPPDILDNSEVAPFVAIRRIYLSFFVLQSILVLYRRRRVIAVGLPPTEGAMRVQMLYRPSDDVNGSQILTRFSRSVLNTRYRNESSTVRQFFDDSPPKYTPPPSYSTATGAKIAKVLRKSFRRSIRRILGDPGRSSTTLQIHYASEYEPSATLSNSCTETQNGMNARISESIEIEDRPSHNLIFGRSLSLGRSQIINKRRIENKDSYTVSHQTNNFDLYRSTRPSHSERAYTAEDVITILRSSTLGRHHVPRSQLPHVGSEYRSIENLVQNDESLDNNSCISENSIKK